MRRIGLGGNAERLRARVGGIQKALIGRVQNSVRSGPRLLDRGRDKTGGGRREVRMSCGARGALNFWGGIREISSSGPRLLWNRHGQRCREVRVRETARPSTGPLGGMKGGPSLLRGPPYNRPGREVSNTRQSRASVGRVPLRLDMASTPPDAGRDLETSGPPALGVQNWVGGAAFLGGQHLAHVVPHRDDDGVLEGRSCRGEPQTHQCYSALESMDL